MRLDNKTFAGIPVEFSGAQSKMVVLPINYDGTSTWGKGADKGPAALLDAAENMELFDIETGTEVYKEGVALLQPLEGFDSPEAMVDGVYKEVSALLSENKFVFSLGGEHSVSIGILRAFDEKFDNLTVVQFDAHTDLRKEYMGTPYNHACAVYEASQKNNLIQVGIRSMDVAETEVLDPFKVYYAHDVVGQKDWHAGFLSQLTENVYITLDLDVFDPSIMPSTGTPEPGGMLWYETLEALKMIFENRNVVGMDIVELAPNEHNGAPDFLAAKLLYKMMTYKCFASKG